MTHNASTQISAFGYAISIALLSLSLASCKWLQANNQLTQEGVADSLDGGPDGQDSGNDLPKDITCDAGRDCSTQLGMAGAGCVWGCGSKRCVRLGECVEQAATACEDPDDCLGPLPNCVDGRWECQQSQCVSLCGSGEFGSECAASRIDLASGGRCTCKCDDCDCAQVECSCELSCYLDDADCIDDPVLTENCTESCMPEGDLSTDMGCTLSCDIEVPPDVEVEIPSLQDLPLEYCDVEVEPDGGLVLDLEDTVTGGSLSYIWIANSDEGTVSKLETATGTEVARYRTGSSSSSDPSRTTVSLNGDAVIANRYLYTSKEPSAVRIQSDVANCPDRNGNGVVDTSQGKNDVLSWGEDECVLWSHEFPSGSVPRAAAFDYGACVDICADRSESVWIGLHNAEKVVQLDAGSGAKIAEVSIPGHMPYGMAFDHSCKLWVVGYLDKTKDLVRIDVNTLQYEVISGSECNHYGIAIDSESRVWTAGNNGCVSRYDPKTGSWRTARTQQRDFNRGVAYDGVGSIWVAATYFGIHRFDEQSMDVLADVSLGGGPFVGTAVDFHGMVWAVEKGKNLAHRIDPINLSSQAFATGDSPYTYSDMTGFQLYNVSKKGYYRSTKQACTIEDKWETLLFSAEAPTATSLQIKARAANSMAEIDKRNFATVATVPSDTSPSNLEQALEAEHPGSSAGLILQVDVTLFSDVPGTTPMLKSIQVTNSGCAGPVDIDVNVQ